MADSSIASLTKIRVHGLKRKKPPSSVSSSEKSKRFKPDDTISLTHSMAYGVHDTSEDSDLDYDNGDLQYTTGSERPVNFLPLDTSQLSRDNGVLFSEDLTDDTEVWTLQCSDDVDVNQLLQESINFQEVSLLKIENAFSHKVDLIPYKSQKDTKITIVVPSERTKNLSLNVVPLAGTLIMSNRVSKEKIANQNSLPVDTIEDATRRRSELMSKVTERLSNKFDVSLNQNNSIKKEIKVETISPRKEKNIHINQ